MKVLLDLKVQCANTEVDRPGLNSVYEGRSPITEQILSGRGNFDDEVWKYARVINDSYNPVARLDVVVSTEDARIFLGQRLESLAKRIEESGLRLPYKIEVEP